MAGYKQFLKYSEEVFREGYEKLAHVPFLNWSSMVSVAPQLIRLKAYRSVYSMVAKHVRDPHLRQLFSFHSLLGRRQSVYDDFDLYPDSLSRAQVGRFFPKGGTGALVRALVKLFKELGGEIRFNAEIAEISTNGDKVTGVVDGDGAPTGFRLGGEQRRCGSYLWQTARARAAGSAHAQMPGEDELQHVAVSNLFRHAAKIS